MKVLWFTNIVLPEFAERLGMARPNQGGWLPSLVEAVRTYAPHVELTIASEGRDETTWETRGVRYVSVQNERSRILRLIDEESPCLIHIHGTEGPWVSLATYVKDVPVVASLQGIVSGCFPHYVGGLLPKEVSSIENLLNIALTRYRIFRGGECWRTKFSARERKAFGTIRAFLGRTEWDAAWTRYLSPDARYFSVGEVLRQPFWQGGRTPQTVVPHSIYCGAAFTYPLKGGHWLLRAVAALRRKFPDIRLRVANARKVARPLNWREWIRQGEYHRYLMHLIRDLGLAGCVDLLPSLTAEQVADELRRAEVFVLPSLCENSPNSLGEAMLMGCPAIATDVGGVKSILKDGEQGALVPSGDPATLAFQIDRFFSEPGLAQTYANAAQQEARVRYDAAHVVRELTTAYQEIAGK